MNDLLPNTASPRACEMLNGLSFGDAPVRVLTEAGDYVRGTILGRRDAPLSKGLTCAVLTIRAAEGQLKGELIEEGQRLTLRCAARQLRDMTARFDPAEGDEIAILLHPQTKAGGTLPYSYNVIKPAPVKQESSW